MSSIVPRPACGVDILSPLIELVTGRRKIARIDKSKLLNRGAGNVYFYLPAGIVFRIEGIEEVRSLPGVHKVALDDLVVGKKIEPMRNLSGRQGPIVYAGEDRQVCEEVVRKIRATLKVAVDTPQGIKGIVWS